MPEVVEIDLERDIIDGAVRKVYQRFRVALGALVAAAYRDTSRADVTLGSRFLATNLTAQDEPPAPDLPVITPRGNGYGLYFDLSPGDIGVALACDAPVRNLFETGEVGTPGRAVGHDYGCAVFFPGGRVSSSVPGQSTDPPNEPGTMVLGADDGSAQVVLRRAGGPSLTEQGTVVIRAATHVPPAKAVLLGGDGAVLGVARLTDTVDASALFLTWISKVTAAINTLAPGSVDPFVGTTIGAISSASDKVASE